MNSKQIVKEILASNRKIEKTCKAICKEVNMKLKGATNFVNCKWTESYAVVTFRDEIEEIQVAYLIDVVKDFNVKLWIEAKDSRLLEVCCGLTRN